MINYLDNIKIVLCNTSHPGNIGSAARAMKTMGIRNLVLVSPKIMPDDQAIALASNARDVVINAQVVSTLRDALQDSHLAIALTSRKREFNYNLQLPKEIIPEILSSIQSKMIVAIVFGNETSGLSIEQLELCNRLVTIPGNPEYFSLNLAQAVQIICYEIYSHYNPSLEHLKSPLSKATFADIQGVLLHLDTILNKTKFYQNKNDERLRRRLQKIVNKANLEREEIDIIRGILKHIEHNIHNCR